MLSGGLVKGRKRGHGEGSDKATKCELICLQLNRFWNPLGNSINLPFGTNISTHTYPNARK